MTGIEILASQKVATDWAYDWAVFWITACVVMMIFVAIGILVAIQECNVVYFFIIFLFGTILSFLGGCGAASITGTPIAYETQYKVTISDEVSMNEFLDKYEIVDQEDKIYTIREKNLNDKGETNYDGK